MGRPKQAHCRRGHDAWHTPPSGKRYCRPCNRARNRVGVRCPSWWHPLPPYPADAERWAAFCREIEARIEIVHAGSVISLRVGRAA